MKRYRWLLIFCVVGVAGVLCGQVPSMGLEWDVQSYRGVPYKARLTAQSYADLPTTASVERYAPTPGDQGAFSTCTAFALAYHTRTILWGIENRETDRARLNANRFSPTFVYELIKPETDVDCKAGSNPIVGLELLRTAGVPPLRTVPYRCGGTIRADYMLEAMDYTIKDFQILFLPDETNGQIRVNSVRKAIAEGWPVVHLFIVPQSFYRPPAIWRPTADDDGPSGQHGRHAMVIVGYDDAKAGGGAFRVLNSWGPDWCDGGYVWIPYDAFAEYSLGAIQVYGRRPAPPAPQPQPGPAPAPRPQPVPHETQLLMGTVAFQRNDGVAMPAARIGSDGAGAQDALSAYRLDRSYPSGTRFRFFLQTSTEVYLYAFASDLTHKVTQILPFQDNMSPLIGANSTLAFPSERHVVRMDDQPGTDFLLILYSSERLDLERVSAAMAEIEGTLSAKLGHALGQKLVPQGAIRYDERGIGFSVDRRAVGTVVPLMIEIPHH